MTTNNPAPGPTWTVTYQQDDIDTSVPGRLTRGVTIGFTTAEGVQSSVFIPASRYPDLGYVQSEIAAKAAQVRSVHQLSG